MARHSSASTTCRTVGGRRKSATSAWWKGNQPCSDNDWEEVKKGGDVAVQAWIDGQLSGRSCALVLIGKDTAGRKWIKYEIEKAWNDGKGLVGVYIHNLLDASSNQTTKGRNPFEDFTMKRDDAKTYDPPYTTRHERLRPHQGEPRGLDRRGRHDPQRLLRFPQVTERPRVVQELSPYAHPCRGVHDPARHD